MVLVLQLVNTSHGELDIVQVALLFIPISLWNLLAWIAPDRTFDLRSLSNLLNSTQLNYKQPTSRKSDTSSLAAPNYRWMHRAPLLLRSRPIRRP
jgi:hypothetical protein